MALIKILLLGSVALVGLFIYRGSPRASHRMLWRVGGSMVVVLAAWSVLFPDAVTALANQVGVGRGADLVLYGLVVVTMLLSVALFRRMSELEARYVALARRVALLDARRGAVEWVGREGDDGSGGVDEA